MADFKRLLLLPLLVPLAAACSRRSTPAIGRLREVSVVTSQWGAVEEPIRQILQTEIGTPRPEPEFLIRMFTPEKFKVYSQFRTLFIVGTPDDTIVSEVLGARLDSLPAGDFGLFRMPNAWADNQEVLVLAAREPEMLERALTEYGPRVLNACREIVLRHFARAAFHYGHNLLAEDSVSTLHAFDIEIPKEWYLKQHHADERFLYMFGHYPDRGVFVYWEDSSRALEPGVLSSLRDAVARRYYDGDASLPEFAVADTLTFLQVPVARIRGVWQNEESVIGGPFVNYSFNYQGRFYMLDGFVYNPGKDKLDQLCQVEAVLRTFTPR